MPYLQGKVPGDIHPQWQPSWVTSTEDHCILECFFFRDPPPSRGSEWGMWRIGAVVQLRRSLRRCLWVSSAALNGSPACCQAAPWRVYPVQTPSSKTLPGTRDNTRLEETCILGKEMNPPPPTHTHTHQRNTLFKVWGRQKKWNGGTRWREGLLPHLRASVLSGDATAVRSSPR